MANLNLRNQAQLRHKLAIRFSNVLEMTESDVTRLVRILESDPMFKRLFYARSPEWKVFRRQRFAGTSVSPSIYELNEAAVREAPNLDVQKLLDAKRDLLAKIRGMGEEVFERDFLFDDGDKSAEALAAELGLPVETVRAVRELTDSVLMHPDFIPGIPAGGDKAQGLHYTRMAEYRKSGGGKPEIDFFSPAMARGAYKVDYERLKKLKADGAFNDKEKRMVQETVRILEMVNARRNLIYRILHWLPHWQEKFFEKADWDELVPFTQKRAAQELNVTPAAVCRAIQDRSVVLETQEEAPLADFFPSRKDILKRKIAPLFKANADKTDLELRDMLQSLAGVGLSRRSVNVYRKEILGKGKTVG